MRTPAKQSLSPRRGAGAWNYHRVCLVIAYCIYKQFLFNFSLFFYSLVSGMSTTSLYHDQERTPFAGSAPRS